MSEQQGNTEPPYVSPALPECVEVPECDTDEPENADILHDQQDLEVESDD